TLEGQKEVNRVSDFRTYIVNRWERIVDCSYIVEDAPTDARSRGCIESRQRHVPFRLKRRGMHWSAIGAESMVTVHQGMLDGAFIEDYLITQKRSKRKQREIKQTVHMSKHVRKTKHANNRRQGSISLYAAHSSAVGRLLKSIT